MRVLCAIRLRDLATSEKRKILKVKLILDYVFHHIFYDGNPARRLIDLLVAAISTRRRPSAFATLLKFLRSTCTRFFSR